MFRDGIFWPHFFWKLNYEDISFAFTETVFPRKSGSNDPPDVPLFVVVLVRCKFRDMDAIFSIF